MYKNNKIAVIIPARGGSEGIRNKNLINFCGKKLIAWSIEQALNSKYVDYLFVSSNDRKILSASGNCGAKVIKRPEKFATNISPTEDALLHAVGYIENTKGLKVDIVMLLQVTSPVRTAQDIDRAIVKFFTTKADSLFSAALLEDFCVWQLRGGQFKSITYDYKKRGRRQDRKPYYLENGSIYIVKTVLLKKYRNRFVGKIGTYLMPYWKSFEIDNPADIPICEYFMKKYNLHQTKFFREVSLKNIRLIVYDFDGVLTDNKVIISEQGLETVSVNRGDGLVIRLMRERGLRQLILSSEINKVVKVRGERLKIPVLSGVVNKKNMLASYCLRHRISLQKVVFIGNDLNDIEVMKSVGFPMCPLDASDEVKKISKIVLPSKGGEGVVRELAKCLGIT